MVKPIWNNAQKVNHQNFAKKTHPCAKKNMVPREVLMKSDLVSIDTVRQHISKTTILVNTARQVNAAHSKTIVNAARPTSYLSKIAHSTVKMPIDKNTSFKNSNINQKDNTVRGKKFNTATLKVVVNDVKGNNLNAVKASACWVWKPEYKVLDHVFKHNNESITLKKFNYIDAQGRSKIENLVDHKVKVIRCDNGTEFKNSKMNQFCEMNGILRQFSVARTTQQSRVADRRNMILIDASRTMLATSKLPT
nr:putative ribonuclease H-like domain-containing protein [Tanacetum cinerariifolium]